MNREKWFATPSAGRLADHLAEVLPAPLLALVLCEVAEHARVELQGGEGRETLDGALQRVRGWAVGRGLPIAWSEVWEADSEEPWPDGEAIAAALLMVPLRRAAAREVIERVSAAFDEGQAPAYFADLLRELVPYVAVAQQRLERTGADRLETEDLVCVLSGGRLIRCEPREGKAEGTPT